jgi:hypothetical protein
VVVGLAAIGAWQLRDRMRLLVALALTLLALPVALAIMSIFHAVAVPRYLAWSTGPLFVLAGVGAAAVPRRLAKAAPAALVVAALCNLAPYYTAETKPRWDLAAAYLGQRLGADDVVVTNGPMAQYVLTKYASRYNLDQAKILGRRSPSEVRTARVWIVTGRTGQGTTPDEIAFDSDWLATRSPSLSVRLGKHLTLQLFEQTMQPSALEQRRPPVLPPRSG